MFSLSTALPAPFASKILVGVHILYLLKLYTFIYLHNHIPKQIFLTERKISLDSTFKKLTEANFIYARGKNTRPFLIRPLSHQNQTTFPSVSSTCKIYSVLNKWWWLSSSKLGRVKGHTCYQTVLFRKACIKKTCVHPGEFQQCNQSLAAVVMTLLCQSIGKAIPENYAQKIL